MSENIIKIFTDGACKGNPGLGGWGALIIEDGEEKEIYGGSFNTTNNKMELTATIEALKFFKDPKIIELYTDSKYVVDSIEKKWLFKWEKIKFKNKKNVDLWLDFLSLYKKNSIKFNWIKGHNNHPQNERCDKLAFNAASGENLFSDTGYEGNDLNTLF